MNTEPASNTPSGYLCAEHLTKRYRRGKKNILALDDVCLDVPRGSSVAIVGESGAGKSTLARILILRTRPTEGKVYFCDRDVTRLSGRERKGFWSRVQMVTQDPSVAFDRRKRVRQILGEPLANFGICKMEEREERAAALLEMVGLDAAYLDRLPAQMSGGEQQRVSLARALAADPECLILDEPTSSLDVTTQEALLDLLAGLRAKRHLTYVFIHHDLGVAQMLAERIVVMKGGRIETELESGALASSDNPYVRELIGAILSLDDPRGSMFGA